MQKNKPGKEDFFIVKPGRESQIYSSKVVAVVVVRGGVSTKKNDDVPGTLGDFVMSLVTERTKKEKQTEKKKKKKKIQNGNSFNFYEIYQH